MALLTYRDTANCSFSITSTAPPFSNYTFAESSFPGCQPLKRLLSLARRLGYKWLSQEELVPSELSALGDEDLGHRKPHDFSKSQVWRIAFFSKAPDDKAFNETTDFLGYAILRRNSFTSDFQDHVYEAVIKCPRYENYYVHCNKTYTVSINGSPLSISGNLFCQQDRYTYVCAQTALRMALAAILPLGDINYQEINQHARVDHVDTVVGEGKGLSSEQIKTVLTKAGISSFRWTAETSNIPYQKYIYGSIESGFPALLGLRLQSEKQDEPSHLVPVFGHTFNQDTWVPNASSSYFTIGNTTQYLPSETWVSSY